jgi:hypothetical protein
MLCVGLKDSQLIRKKEVVNNCTISSAERYPSEKAAILLSVSPNN